LSTKAGHAGWAGKKRRGHETLKEMTSKRGTDGGGENQTLKGTELQRKMSLQCKRSAVEEHFKGSGSWGRGGQAPLEGPEKGIEVTRENGTS